MKVQRFDLFAKIAIWAVVGAVLIFVIFPLINWQKRRMRNNKSRRNYDRQLAEDANLGAAQFQSVAERVKVSPLQVYSTEELKSMARTLHSGVPDRYTSTGELVGGTAPDAYRAVEVYEELLNRGDSSILESFANLLENGVAGNDRVIDLTRASRLYYDHFNCQTDPHARYGALDAVERLAPQWQKAHISQLRGDVARQCVAASKQKVIKTSPAVFNTIPTAFRPLVNPHPIRTTNEDIWVIPTGGFRAPDFTTIQEPNGIRNDLHNSHDSGVTATVRASIDKLKSLHPGTPQYDAVKTLRDVRTLIETDDEISPDRRGNAIMALDGIERNNQTLGTVNVSEIDLLNLVWNRIHHNDNQTNRQVLKENLMEELSECIEGKRLVCSTGRFNRLVGALNGVDAIVNVKPKWALSKEMIEKAGNIHAIKLKSLAEPDRIAFETFEPSGEEAETAKRIADDIKQEINQELKKDYVESGIMSQEAVDVETSKWIDDIV